MRLCFELAELGKGSVAPNPLVGAVLVKNGRIIGKGYHRSYGEGHAEVEAIESVHDKTDVSGSTLYVNLEPCVHHGNTPPCCDRIIQEGIAKVVIAEIDPNQKVKGKGVERLRNSGLEVKTGVLSKDEILLNKRFRTFHEKKRPYIILKWAESQDGFMDIERSGGEKGQFMISNAATQSVLHKWRSEEDAIMIGTNTAVNDDPSLTVRLIKGKNPSRFIIDLNDRLPDTLKMFRDGFPVTVYSGNRDGTFGTREYVRIKNRLNLLEEIMNDMYLRQVQSVLIEGGSILLKSFIEIGLWDEIRVFKGNGLIKNGIKAPEVGSSPISTEVIGDNELLLFRKSQ